MENRGALMNGIEKGGGAKETQAQTCICYFGCHFFFKIMMELMEFRVQVQVCNSSELFFSFLVSWNGGSMKGRLGSQEH